MAAGDFYRDLLDLDTYIPKGEGKWPSLKVVYDNLRCYPILVIFALAIRLLAKSPDFLGLLAFWFLLPIFVLLFLATVVQTAVMLAVLTVGVLSSYLQPNERVAAILAKRERLMNGLIVVFLITLGFVCVFTAFRLFAAFLKVFPGAA